MNLSWSKVGSCLWSMNALSPFWYLCTPLDSLPQAPTACRRDCVASLLRQMSIASLGVKFFVTTFYCVVISNTNHQCISDQLIHETCTKFRFRERHFSKTRHKIIHCLTILLRSVIEQITFIYHVCFTQNGFIHFLYKFDIILNSTHCISQYPWEPLYVKTQLVNICLSAFQEEQQ